MALFRLRISVKVFVPIYLFSKPLQIWLRNSQHLFIIINFIIKQVYTSVKMFVRIMPFFRLKISVKFSVLISKLTTLIHHHYLQQQTRVHNSVNVFVRIIAIFSLITLVKFFEPPHFFSKPLVIQVIHLQYFLIIITSINRQGYIICHVLFKNDSPFSIYNFG